MNTNQGAEIMATTHTPGPWAVNDKDTGMNDSGTIEGCGIVICPDVYGESRERTNANAALIAAAPELLAIIKDMRQAFYVKGTRKALLEVMERSKDIIAKAEGA